LGRPALRWLSAATKGSAWFKRGALLGDFFLGGARGPGITCTACVYKRGGPSCATSDAKLCNETTAQHAINTSELSPTMGLKRKEGEANDVGFQL